MSDHARIDIPDFTQTAEEAALLLKHIQVEQHDCKLVLSSAVAQLQEAHLRVRDAKNQLFEADMHVGRVLYIIDRCGFGEVS